ncbi:MAG: AraC family transcriptional regulator [Methylacidiphilales bacterium]|nr:AraC family transcriptional regulator [Candidatus Methylacidiphilales bacterium]
MPTSRTRRPVRQRARRAAPEPRYFSAQVSEAKRFFLDLNPASMGELAAVSGGCEHCQPDYSIKRSGFPFTTIEFVARGLGRLWLNGRIYDLTPGTVFVYGRNIPHQMQSDAQNPLVKYFVLFDGRSRRELMKECQLGHGRVLRVAHPEQIQQVFEDLIRHGRSDHPRRVRICTVALQYLMMKIGDDALPYGKTVGRAFATYQRCRQFIEEHYTEVRSLREVADACHLDLAYLCRLFQRFGRERPNRYLQHLRLNRAAELLQQSERAIKDVAAELGFSDPYNFSRAFHRNFGFPPGRIRQISRGASGRGRAGDSGNRHAAT